MLKVSRFLALFFSRRGRPAHYLSHYSRVLYQILKGELAFSYYCNLKIILARTHPILNLSCYIIKVLVSR